MPNNPLAPTQREAIRVAIIALDQAGCLTDDERLRRGYDESRDALRGVMGEVCGG